MTLQNWTAAQSCPSLPSFGSTRAASDPAAPGTAAFTPAATQPLPSAGSDANAPAVRQRLEAAGLQASGLDATGNPPIDAIDIPFAWQDLNHPMLARMVKDYRLDEVIGTGADEFEQLLRLRHWVHVNIPRGNPEWEPDQAWLLADLARNGRAFYCSYYANLLMYAAAALGWPARHVGVDCDHAEGERSTHHGVAEVFCYQLDKWVVLDAMFDVHFESDVMPLSAMEVRNTLQVRGAESIDRVEGLARQKTPTRKDVAPDGFDHAGCYFWFHVPTRNNHFSQPAWQGNERMLLYVDDLNRDKIWYQNQYGDEGQFLGSRPHTGYRTGKFLKTEHVADVYPPLGRTHIDFDLSLPRGKGAAVLPAVLYTINPYWQGFEVRFDEKGSWVPIGRHVDWRLRSGHNAIEVRLIAAAGRRGKPARMDMLLERHSGAAPK